MFYTPFFWSRYSLKTEHEVTKAASIHRTRAGWASKFWWESPMAKCQLVISAVEKIDQRGHICLVRIHLRFFAHFHKHVLLKFGTSSNTRVFSTQFCSTCKAPRVWCAGPLLRHNYKQIRGQQPMLRLIQRILANCKTNVCFSCRKDTLKLRKNMKHFRVVNQGIYIPSVLTSASSVTNNILLRVPSGPTFEAFASLDPAKERSRSWWTRGVKNILLKICLWVVWVKILYPNSL